MAQLNVKVRRIADWLAGAADTLTAEEIRMAAKHLRDVVDGRPLDLSGFLAERSAPPAGAVR